jgi:hypothetical protein
MGYTTANNHQVDLVLAWLMADLNTQFIEALPEATATMAFGLQNAMMARTSFSILVSEEALSLASRLSGHFEADRNGVNQFGRVREDIDEDLRTRIEYGSKIFHERVNTTFQNLIDKNMLWFQNLPEYQKIIRFEHSILHGRKHKNFEDWHRCICELVDNLRHHIRGQIMRAAVAKLGVKEGNEANLRRKKEQYKPDTLLPPFEVVYEKLTLNERIFTRYFWEYLQELSFKSYGYDTYPMEDNNSYTLLARANEIKSVTATDLHLSSTRFNHSVISAVTNKCFGDGPVPSGATTNVGGAASLSPCPRSPGSGCPVDELGFGVIDVGTPLSPCPQKVNNKTVHLGKASAIPVRPKWYQEVRSDAPGIIPGPSSCGSDIAEGAALNIEPSSRSPSCLQNIQGISYGEPVERAILPNERVITPDSVFNAFNFVSEAKNYVTTVCRQMLNTSEIKFDVMLTDTLLCLGAEEFKYLPLWAGGDDDGTGGVFDEPIPEAIAGPSGPGPEFHTGYSAAGSVVSGSELSDDDYETVSLRAGLSLANTSIAVEDGYSDNIGDRRHVVVDNDDIHSETFSEDTSLYNEVRERDKGKAVDRSSWGIAAAGGVTSSGLSDAMEDIDVSDSATELNFDGKEPDTIGHNPSAAAARAESPIDGEIDWDSEEETFDYGDDEEMSDD